MVTTPIPFSASILTIQRTLQQIGVDQTNSLIRLATGSRLNRASDDPAALISAENLRSVLATLEAESVSLERADAVIATADGALGEISGLLVDAQALVVASANTAGLSPEEIEANQMELDSILSSVDSIAGSTTFNGDQLLDGTAQVVVDSQTLAIDGVSAGDLGLAGLDLVNGDPEANQQALDAAISQVATTRGELGAFSSDIIGVRMNSIGTAIQYTTAAESVIRDTDYAAEVSNLVRLKVLQTAALGALGLAERARESLLGGLFGNSGE